MPPLRCGQRRPSSATSQATWWPSRSCPRHSTWSRSGTKGGAGPEAERAERIFELVRESVAATSRARLSLQIAEGRKVAPSICDYAAEQGFDLLVLGRHSDSSLLHHRLGHVAEAAARSSRIPVLLLGAQ
jgi:nucleotide-binding universal stress UspA family protein